MRRSWWISAAASWLVAATGAAQAPGYRLTYRLEVVRADPAGPRTLAHGEISGPLETGLRLSLRNYTLEVEALLGVVGEEDSLTVTAEFFSKRAVARSRRGLPLWEQDAYTRTVRLAWGDTIRIFPLGSPHSGGADSLWVALAMAREPAGGETRPAETVQIATESGLDVAIEAVVRPRRTVVVLNLVRGALVSAPRRYDLVPEGSSRRVEFVLSGPAGAGRAGRRTLEVRLVRPDPPRSPRDRALALDADLVCLRVTEPLADAPAAPAGVLCGRLNNVARRLPLAGGDTLVATFAWPGYR